MTPKEEAEQRSRGSFARYLGANLFEALSDPATEELSVNTDGQVWLVRNGESTPLSLGVLTYERAEAIVRLVAGIHEKVATKASPNIEADLPWDGSRFAGVLPPVARWPTFSIRKHTRSERKLDDYVADGSMSEEQRRAILEAVADRQNILVVGGTGSGKTTLANALIAAAVGHFPTDRWFILEDTRELNCAAPNTVYLTSHLDFPMTSVVRSTMRLRPDRIVVGEVRGAEALDLIDAWNSGHEGGISTLHANSAELGLTKLERYISRSPFAPRIGLRELVAEAVHLVIHVRRGPDGRKVREVITVAGYSEETGYAIERVG